MFQIKKVLITTDFSEAAHHAMPHAIEFARRYGAELTVLHVRTLYSDDPANLEYQFLDEESYGKSLQSNLEEASQPIGKSVRFNTSIVRNISPAAGIVEYSQENGIDLIVMGTHGRSALGHFFLGSVAEKVVRHADCPVLTVGKKDDYIDRPAHQRILSAFDFSEHSIQAARNALDISRKFGAQLVVFYALEQEVHPAFFATWKLSVEHHMDEITSNVKKALTEALGEKALKGVEIEVRIGNDRSDREIRRYCREKDVDLIIMGTHGLSGLDRALLGSTTERVVRIAPCPVLTFHLPE